MFGEPTQSEKDERRSTIRQRVLKGASILQGIDRSEIECTVRNMSTEGAELRVPEGIAVPGEFLLYIPVDGIGYQSVVRWRDGQRVGVMFIGRQPKPLWHYG